MYKIFEKWLKIGDYPKTAKKLHISTLHNVPSEKSKSITSNSEKVTLEAILRDFFLIFKFNTLQS
jgi:hypothetical protein